MATKLKESEGLDEPILTQEGSCEPSIYHELQNRLDMVKMTILLKLQTGLENGSNIDHCLKVSEIYKNLC